MTRKESDRAGIADRLSYSEARQKLARVLDRAESTGKVLIRRKDGRTFALTPEKNQQSPLDVPSIRGAISTKELVALVRKERGRTESAGINRHRVGDDKFLIKAFWKTL